MTIAQLKRLIANLPESTPILVWDKDTANPIQRVMGYNIEPGPVKDVEVVRCDESCVGDFASPPSAALIFVAAD